MFHKRRTRALSADEVLDRALAQADREGLVYPSVLKALLDSVDDPASPLFGVLNQPATEQEAELARVFVAAAVKALQTNDHQILIEVAMVGAALMVVWNRHLRKTSAVDRSPPPPLAGDATNGVDLLREALTEARHQNDSMHLRELDWQLFRVALGTNDALVRVSTEHSFDELLYPHQAEAGAVLIEALTLAATEGGRETLVGVFDVLPILLMRLEAAIEVQGVRPLPWE